MAKRTTAKALICVAFICASLVSLLTGHEDAAGWFGIFALLAWIDV